MQVSAISNINCGTPRKVQSGVKSQNPVNNYADNQSLSFEGRKKDGKAGRMVTAGTAMAMFLVPIASSSLQSCDKDGYAYAYTNIDIDTSKTTTPGSIIDTTIYIHPADTVIKWYQNYERPQPLDSLFNNFQNWGIDGTDGVDPNDSTAKRNIIHYEGTREWEYNNKEIGDMNVLESTPKKNLVYDIEVKDYKGNHLYYGKSVLRIPTGSFTVTTKDGRVLNSPKGFFVESYKNDADEKGGSIYDCTLQSRAFCQTNGDTLFVAKRSGSSDYVEKGKVSNGYLGKNTILLQNLIGQYDTDEHYVDMKINAVNDNDLRLLYLKAKDEEE